MARASPITTSFNAGELSPLTAGRVDIGKYQSSLRRCENYLPILQGPAVRRGGFRYLGETKYRDRRAWLVKFEFSRQQSYMLEFGDNYIRFWADRGQVIVTSAAAWSNVTAYVVGNYVSFGGLIYRSIQNGTNQQPNTSPAYWVQDDVYEIPSPYSATNDDMIDAEGHFNLRFEQSGDVVYICCPNWRPYRLSRLGNTNWTMEPIEFIGGPFQDQNQTGITVYASAETGAVSLTSSAPIFLPTDAGTLFYLEQKDILSVLPWTSSTATTAGDIRRYDGKNYKALNTATTGVEPPVHTRGARYDGATGVQWEYQDPGYGIVRITGVTNGSLAGGVVVPISTEQLAGHIPSNAVGPTNATLKWAKDAWSVTEGWPTQVAFFRERLCFNRSFYGWMSVVGDYENFVGTDLAGDVVADSAISYQLQSGQINEIQWIKALNSATVAGLICGTLGGEFVVKSQNDSQPFGPANIDAVLISQIGSVNAAPLSVNADILFVQRTGSVLRNVSFDFVSNGYQSVEQSLLANHMLKPQVLQVAFQLSPNSIAWARRSDGGLIAMTYSREQYPEIPHGGWHRHPIVGGLVESIETKPSPDGTNDELWVIANYAIDGTERRYVMVQEQYLDQDEDPISSFYVDCGLSLYNTVDVGMSFTSGDPTVQGDEVTATASGAAFVVGDVGNEIHVRYATLDESSLEWIYRTGKALITGYSSPTTVTATVTAAFEDAGPFVADGWAISFGTISGLDHLEGETVKVLLDGATHPDRVVTGGEITLDRQGAYAHVGHAMTSRMQTQRQNAGSQDGTSQGKKTRINSMVVRLDRTVGLLYGPEFDAMRAADFRTPAMLMDNAVPLFTGDKELWWEAGWGTNPWLCIAQTDPLPQTIIAIMPQVVVSDKG